MVIHNSTEKKLGAIGVRSYEIFEGKSVRTIHQVQDLPDSVAEVDDMEGAVMRFGILKLLQGVEINLPNIPAPVSS